MINKANHLLKKVFPGKLNVAQLFSYPTIRRLAGYLRCAQRPGGASAKKTPHGSAVKTDADGIAVVGIALRASLAQNKNEFWRNLKTAQDCTREIPLSRKRDADYFNIKCGNGGDARLGFPGTAYLEEVDKFDYSYFNLSPKEASLMDPNQRLFLETVFEVIDDAGEAGRIKNTKTGLYVGFAADDDYTRLISEINPDDLNQSLIGNTESLIFGRIAHLLNLRGPGLSINTACSSSLVAVHMACRAIRNGDCDQAIVGGIRLYLLPHEGEGIGIESKDGPTQSFDNAATGINRGEGVATIFLKPLSLAMAEKNNIYAVIRGSAINQDGASASLTAPNAAAQAEVIESAWQDANIDPKTISYIEAHGTGTKLGDPIEIGGITKAFRKYTDNKHFCRIGSVKSNIGHTVEAAGLFGLAKAALALKHKQLPASVHFNEPNQGIDWENSPVTVNTRLAGWQRINHDIPLRCGISSFGLSGTNCHVVLEEAPEISLRKEEKRPRLLLLSAKTEASLKTTAENYRKFLSDPDNRDISLADMSYTAAVGRDHHEHRLAIVAESLADLRDKLVHLIQTGLEKSRDDSFCHIRPEAVSAGKKRKNSKEQQRLTRDADNLIKAGIISSSGLRALARLYAQGANPDWNILFQNEDVRKASLPAYPFARTRCWIEIPEERGSGNYFHRLVWQREVPLTAPVAPVSSGTTVFFCVADSDFSVGLKEYYKKHNIGRIIEVTPGNEYRKKDNNRYAVSSRQEDYDRLMTDLGYIQISRIIHAFTITNNKDVEGGIKSVKALEKNQELGVLSLFHLVRATQKNPTGGNIEIVLLSNYTDAVTGKEKKTNPENATLIGLGKTVNLENPNIRCRAIDFDDQTRPDIVISEIFSTYTVYKTAYRDNERYAEVLDEFDVSKALDSGLKIKKDNVYLITGGFGNLGLAAARYLVRKNRIKLVLLSRKPLFFKNKKDDKDQKTTAKKMAIIKEMERTGSEIIVLSADVSREGELKRALEKIHGKYGKISGIIHAAGLTDKGLIVDRNGKSLSDVLAPKVSGTWLLDRLIRKDEPDFFINFSSAMVIMGGRGASGYTAANCYLNSFSDYRRCENNITTNYISIMWPNWEGLGLIQGSDIDKTRQLFFPTNEEEAMDRFDYVFNKKIANNFVVGRLNYDSEILSLGNYLPFTFSSALQKKVNRHQERLKRTGTYIDGPSTDIIPPSLKGRQAEKEYTEIERKVASVWRSVLGYDEIDVNANFFEIGGDSLSIIQVHRQLEKFYPGLINIAQLFTNPTVVKLAGWLDSIAGKVEAERTPVIARSKVDRSDISDIAITGIALKTSLAEGIPDFWHNLHCGQDCAREFPGTRQEDIDRYMDFKEKRTKRGDRTHRRTGYISEIDKFDYAYFNLSPQESVLMDPSQRLFLQTVYEAIDDAGEAGKLKHTKTGLYLGFSDRHSYSRMINDINPDIFPQATVGNTTGLTPSRISYFLDLNGPSLVTDTTCSSSLVALHIACKSIQRGECDQAIAGGIKLNILPTGKINIGIESKDGLTRSFDDSADGTNWSEAVAAVILKPLARALADKDNIYAVIKGSAINQDGAGVGLTAPNAAAQSEVIISAWKDANIDPKTISYIEAHGTGTKLGDPIEIEGITRAFRKYTDKTHFCKIGSVKSNLGHTAEASGLVGLIKACLALKHKQIPPSIHFKEPNKKIDWNKAPVTVNAKLIPWKRQDENTPLRCGVSSFGLSGTNCHVVLEEAPPQLRFGGVNPADNSGGVHPAIGGINSEIPMLSSAELRRTRPVSGTKSAPYLLLLSAKTEASLKTTIENYHKFLSDPENKDIALADIAYTAAVGRDHHEHRLAIVVSEKKELKEKLAALEKAGPDEWSMVGNYYAQHRVLSLIGAKKEKGDLTPREHKESIQEAEKILTEKSSRKQLEKLAKLYIRGANPDWNRLYQNEDVRKISLPAYAFAKTRCWIEVPETRNFFHRLVWQKEPILTSIDARSRSSETTLFFADDNRFARELAKVMASGQELGRVISVSLGTVFKQKSSLSYIIGNSQKDYDQLIANLKNEPVTRIIHAFSLKSQKENTAQSLAQSQEAGVMSLFRFARALQKNRADNTPVDITILSQGADIVIPEDKKIIPESAPIIGLGKAVSLENPHLRCRAIDIGEKTDIKHIVKEINSPYSSYKTAYRHNERYIEVLDELDLSIFPDNKTEIKKNNVYMITGGLGSLGLATARHLSRQARIKLALISRTPLPPRETWDAIIGKTHIITAEKDKLIQRLKTIREIEKTGSEVFICNADVSREKQIKKAITAIRKKYGKINGIVHAAGIAGDGFIIRKSEATFKNVLAPKITGTWLLNRLTEKDKLDFFISFSSAAAIFSAPGQGDYTAANSYLDAFAGYQRLRHKNIVKTLSINWGAWQEIGMARDWQVDMEKGALKSTSSREAGELLSLLLTKDTKNGSVLAGELNYASLTEKTRKEEKNIFRPVGFSAGIMDRIKIYAQAAPLGPTTPVTPPTPPILRGKKEDKDYTETEKKVASVWQEVLGYKEIDVNENFFEIGGDSLLIIQIHQRLNKLYPDKINIAQLFTYPTIVKLAKHLSETTARETSLISAPFQSRPLPAVTNNDIAIIGVSLKISFAENTAQFWNNLKGSKDFIRELPMSRRRDIERYINFKNQGQTKHYLYPKSGYLDHIDGFDHKYFRLSPKEASLMDPNQRLFLETVCAAIQDSGQKIEGLYGDKIGLYAAHSSVLSAVVSYQEIIKDVDKKFVSSSIPGNMKAIIPGRVSFLFNFRGPSMLIDTACSSSLVAVHLACRAIRNGDCDQAIVGATKIMLLPLEGEVGLGIESSDKYTRSFDDKADGSGFGEGTVSVLLKPLSRAAKEKNHIYAVIKGSAVNQDGASAGITAPNAAAQAEVIESAWKDANIDPKTISYIEAHGTGTKLGDPIEIEGITRAFKKYTAKTQFCSIGSVKSNIGHLDYAAGLFGLVKSVLSLKHKQIPPSIHFNEPNRKIDWNNAPVMVNTKLIPWKRQDGNTPLRCGVSSFGFSGTNCHVVLEEAPPSFRSAELRRTRPASGTKPVPYLLLLSAKTETSLKTTVENYRKFLSDPDNRDISLADMSYTAATGRDHPEHRLAIVVSDKKELKDKLAVLEKASPDKWNRAENKEVYYGRHRVLS
ncbi:MAG: SDR family NAD(P)-dependent oxidoreductase, partial [Candidatus Falkowbacteria bacterium]